MGELTYGRWESDPGEGELALVDGMQAPVGTELQVLLPAEPGHRVWTCRVEGEQLRLGGGTTLVVRAISEVL